MAHPLPDVDPAWQALPLIPEHVDNLVKSAIRPEVAERIGVRSLTRIQDIIDYAPGISQKTSMLGMLIPWHAPDGRIVPQIRLDIPLPDIKYMSPKSEDMGPQPFGIIRQGTELSKLIFVEGAKQAMAIASWIPDEIDITIVAMQGCWGWAHADTHIAAGRECCICPDADYSSNLDVHRAIKLFGENLEVVGATSVKFMKVPATGKEGADDWLARLPEAARALAATNLVDKATARMGRPPAARRLRSVSTNNTSTAAFFDVDGKFLPQDAADALAREFPLGMKEGDETPYVYSPTGVYVPGLATVQEVFCIRLGNDYLTSYKYLLEDKLTAMAKEGTQLEELLTVPILNCRNGVVNLDTLEFTPHSPDYPCTIQIPFDYDPDAECPAFDAFMAKHAGSQAESILEHTSTMLDHTKAPERAIMIYGEGGTGKTTFMEVITKLAGGYASHQSLHAVAEDKFSQAQLCGKILNTCGDLSSKDINDPSKFKQITGGGDTIEAQRKYGKHVTFKPRALMLFSMNEVPRVSENTNAFFRRIAPYRFDVKYPGDGTAINEYVHQHELEGVLNRLVKCAHNMRKRGAALPPDALVVKEYRGKVDRVYGWFDNYCEIVELGTPSKELYQHFLQKAEKDSEKPMSYNTFVTRLKRIEGVKDHRPYIMGKQMRLINVNVLPGGGRDDDDFGDPTPEPTPPPAPEEPVTPTPTSTLTPVSLDLETGSVDDMYANKDESFIRLVGVQAEPDEDVQIFTNYEKGMIAGPIIGQNVIAYDLAVLAHRGLYDLEPVIAGEVEVYDTMIAARLSDPPPARQSDAQERGRYSLAGLAKRFDLPIEKDILPKLAKAYGGYDQIPQDHSEYRRYLKNDVLVTRTVAEKLGPLDDYAKREMRAAAIAAQMSVTGIRVDVPLLEERLEAGRVKKEAALQKLHDEFGLPLEGKSPHASAAGKAALKAAFKAAGAKPDDATRTDSGDISFSKDAMDKILQRRQDNPELIELASLVKELNGIRTVYGTVHDYLHGDRVHPQISMKQASGRWSITKPGLTVMGKRGENAKEREMFLPEPGEVFLSCDLAQVDARCVAALSECDGYRRMFRPGVDLHTEVAVAIFGDEKQRQLAKVVSHGWNYGASPEGIAWATGVPIEVAREYDETATHRFPGVVAWRRMLETLTNQGIYLDNGWGRKLLGDPQRAKTQSPGLVGQSAARDIAIECILRMDPEVRRCLRLWIHDEILLSVPEDKYEEYRDRVLEAMSFQWKGIDFMGDSGKPGINWGRVYDK